MATDITADEIDDRRRRRRNGKKRKGGTLPYPPADDDVEQIREWLTAAFRPPAGWRVIDFERPVVGDLDQHCYLVLVNGNEHRRYRFSRQRDLSSGPGRLRAAVDDVTRGNLRIPELKTGEAGDVWESLCRIGRVLSEQSKPEEAHQWLTKFLEVTRPFEGYTLTAGADRRDALLALNNWGEFNHLDARTVLKSPDDPWPRRPVCLIDKATSDYWIRHREAIVYLRYIEDLKPFSDTTLLARWREIGVERREFEERPPHLRASLYRIPRDVITQ